MSDRARQFMPFDALKGFKQEIKKREKIIVSKKRISEESAEVLSYKMSQVKKGMLIKIIYYENGEYIQLEGLVSNIDLIYKEITIVKTKVHFKDIYDISGTDIKEYLDLEI